MTTRPPYRLNHPRPVECYQGHAYTPDNTRVVTNDLGREVRRCRECEREWNRAAKARRRTGQ